MPVALHSWKKDADGTIHLRHTFYAATEAEAKALMEEHGEGCKAFGPALEEGHTIEMTEEIELLPTVETVEDWGEEGVFVDDDEEDEEDDDDEDEEDDED